MSFLFRGKRRGFLAALIACALTAILLGGIAQSASAWVPCPTGETRAGDIDRWETNFPSGEEDAGGVTFCQGNGGFLGADTMGYLEIVDLRDGARIGLMAKAAPETPPRSYETETLYTKRTAEGWYEWIKNLSINPFEREFDWSNFLYTFPTPRQLFSITNAGFFTRTENNVPTEVPFPLLQPNINNSYGVSINRGIGDFDYDAPKESLMFGSPFEPETQTVAIETFPTNYEWEALEELAYIGRDPYEAGTWSATVSFTPEFRIGEGAARRNYLGIYGQVVYIFTSDNEYTNAETVEIMNEIQPGMEMIQLDGGGSAQLYTDGYGDMDSSIPDIPPLYEDRQVASVLAVYRAPARE